MTLSRSLVILQITDLHLFHDPVTHFLKINPALNLKRIVQRIKNNPQLQHPDLLLLTGDLTQDNSLASYQLAQQILTPLGCPILAINGNHDIPSFLTAVFSTQNYWQLPNWQFIGLNTLITDEVAGYVQPQELLFLQQQLQLHPELNHVIFLHHHLLPVQSNWLDKIILTNSAELINITNNSQKTCIFLSGHVHQTFQTCQKQHFLTTPATSWQFAYRSHEFKLGCEMPGYRWLILHADGSFYSGIDRLPYDPQLIPDLKSHGY